MSGHPRSASEVLAAIFDHQTGKIKTEASIVQSPPGVLKTYYNELTNVNPNELAIVQTMTVSNPGYLQRIEVSGDNIATYDVLLNGILIDRKRSYFGGALNLDFDFVHPAQHGINISPDDTITVRVLHKRPDSANFNSRIQVIET